MVKMFIDFTAINYFWIGAALLSVILCIVSMECKSF